MKTILSGFLVIFLAASGHAQDRVNDPSSFTWHPERAPSGPVVVTVDLGKQAAVVYRNGIEIGTCEVSTGRAGYETPTGTFHILEKDADHHSSTYDNASMPYSQRLTWGGVALHAGGLPGYPSSHGCIHLPYEFSQKLFEITEMGGTVVISETIVEEPVSTGHRIEFTAHEETDVMLEPHAAAAGPTSILFSSEDKGVIVIRNGVPIASGKAELGWFAAKPKGTYTYVADGWTRDEDGVPHPHWHQVAGPEGSAQIKAFGEVKIDPRLKHVIDVLVQPGTTLVLTDETLKGKTRSEPGFSIMGTAPPAPPPPVN
ncbi:MAG: L,D-transpeptidase family protein [Verrucomicrobiota bacterium]